MGISVGQTLVRLNTRRQSLAAQSFTAAAAFTPSSITGQLGWFKADAITSLSDADPVTTWVDSSSNAYDATQSTAANKPTYKTNIQNSLPVVRFAAAASPNADYLVSNMPADTKPCTGFAVVKLTNIATDYQAILAGYDGNGALHWLVEQTTGLQTLNKEDIATIGVATSGAFVNATWTIAAFTYSGAGVYTFYTNGGSNVGTGTGNQALTSRTTSIGASANSVPATGYGWTGDMGELIKYDSVLSTANLNNVGGYLGTKWNITWSTVP